MYRENTQRQEVLISVTPTYHLKNRTQCIYGRHTIYLVYRQFLGTCLAPWTRRLGKAYACGRNTEFRLKVSVPVLQVLVLPFANCVTWATTLINQNFLSCCFPDERSKGVLFGFFVCFVLFSLGADGRDEEYLKMWVSVYLERRT